MILGVPTSIVIVVTMLEIDLLESLVLEIDALSFEPHNVTNFDSLEIFFDEMLKFLGLLV